ncbi:hypothetical protein [Burkholderia cenocepacia]|uniref:hypothetical protein n=1 Tax=Burkholderia cenocepacia TaxID=95486 RepID=UPI002652039B|nr:hypothetical protein [Burkholderia cenocepacia]MDN7695059.1 hypothetical protein [Burkholderia cenocepacia]
MSENAQVLAFADAVAEAVFDGYTLITRYVTLVAGGKRQIWAAVLEATSAKPRPEYCFRLEIEDVAVGHAEVTIENVKDLVGALKTASVGRLEIDGQQLDLIGRDMEQTEIPLHYQLHNTLGKWASPITFEVKNPRFGELPTRNREYFDTSLRLADPPFDGLDDVAGWLGLKVTGQVQPSISIVVHPAADLLLDACKLKDNRLMLVIEAVSHLDPNAMSVMVREAPGLGVQTRKRLSDRILWTQDGDKRIGNLTVDLRNAHAALVMLVVGKHTVRRHWFTDPAKAPNHRLSTMNHFDHGLRKLVEALRGNSNQQNEFEKAVAALLFLLGFMVGAPSESEAPDLIAVTPAARLLLVECTVSVKDIHTKMGKLVDRRESLRNVQGTANPMSEPIAVLVCKAPRARIANAADAKKHGVILWAGEQIEEAIARAVVPNNPDEIMEQALESLWDDTTAPSSGNA